MLFVILFFLNQKEISENDYKKEDYKQVTASYKEKFLETRVDICELDEFGFMSVTGVVKNKGNLRVNEIDVGVDFYNGETAIDYSKTGVLNIPSNEERVFNTLSTSTNKITECRASIVIYPWEYEEEQEQIKIETTIPQKTEIKESTLSSTEKQTICNDILAYFDWCYDNSVSAEDCGNQAHEKVLRLYDITNSQLQEVLAYC